MRLVELATGDVKPKTLICRGRSRKAPLIPMGDESKAIRKDARMAITHIH